MKIGGVPTYVCKKWEKAAAVLLGHDQSDNKAQNKKNNNNLLRQSLCVSVYHNYGKQGIINLQHN
jgi:hypothetical protein